MDELQGNLGVEKQVNEARIGVKVPERTIPFPSSVSQDARATLEKLVDDAGAPRNAAFVMPDPQDRDGWVRIKAAVDVQYAAAVKGAAGLSTATIESVQLGDAVIHVASPGDGARGERAILDFHGGALVFGGGKACRVGAQMQATRHHVRCYGIDYRTPPEHPHPAAVEDGLVAYRHALQHHQPGSIVFSGRSAGGNIALATLLKARSEGLPMPAGLILLSPQVDLTESGDSFEVNRLVDVVLPGSLMSNNLLYAAGADLAHPDLSPLFGDLSGMPTTLLQSGTRDLFLSNTVRLHRAMRQAGVEAELHVFEAMPHGGFGGQTPEDRELEGEIATFVARSWR
jgi:epsilon-lactone hydrolase